MNRLKDFIPYGAVYFRKSNPPVRDWERDYKTAARDGMNLFRHWFLWGAIEVAPGVYDWADYDRQLELGERYGIKTIVAEISHAVPEWVYRRYPELLYRDRDGRPVHSEMGVSSATGGFARGSAGALCLDHPESRELVGGFLTALARRYRDHPAMLGYDVWNECNYAPDICYCEQTRRKFTAWLEGKYGDLAAVNRAWARYSYSSWDDVQIPRVSEPYQECMDWLMFKRDNFYEQMDWRIGVIRAVDEKNLITAHGVGSSITGAANGCDEWRAARAVQVYGFTWVASRHTDRPYEQFCAVDQTRAGAGDKPFWHAEAQGGPLWLQPQVVGRPPEDGRVTAPEDIRLWNLTSFAGGARGLLYPRWRPLLGGPLFGAFGPYEMDGSPTPRSEMASSVATWLHAPEQRELLTARPVRGDVGILLAPEAQLFDGLLTGEGYYARCVYGAYQGFFDNNIQADFVRPDTMAAYDLLYLPHPLLLEADTVRRLTEWVENGGVLISEALPAYFGGDATVDPRQPGQGLDRLFGVREASASFMPDIGDDLHLEFEGRRIRGGLYSQTFRLKGATALATSGGEAAMSLHLCGKGKAILLGTYPSYGYGKYREADNRRFFARLLRLADKGQAVTVSHPDVTARLQADGERLYLWALNHGREKANALVALNSALGETLAPACYWNDGIAQLGDNRYLAEIPPRDAVICRLR